jgi:hypothetical protein
MLLLGNEPAKDEAQNVWMVKSEKMKSTTVRFTDSDLRLIDSLQEKLGLGMVHVIRLAIRRLAEAENVLLLPSRPKKH